MLAAIVNVTHLVKASGYPLLFVLVMSESSGLPIPGETALIASAVLASEGTLDITLVIALAATAAITGDNIGYLIGRKGGRWLLQRPGRFHYQRMQVLLTGEPFFERHGPKAVFLGRFVLGLRVWASWLAGISRMHWRSFALWNALGGICWATAVGVAGYLLGRSAGGAIEAFGLYGLIALALAVGALLVWHRRHRRHRAAHTRTQPADGEGGAGDGSSDAPVEPDAAGTTGALAPGPRSGQAPPS